MASALLASRNESYWGERKVYMRKNPNPNPNKSTFDSANPNSATTAGRQEEPPSTSGNHLRSDLDRDRTVSDGSTSHNHKSISLNRKQPVTAVIPSNAIYDDSYVTFNVAGYSKQELRELKKKLISELDQIRALKNRIEIREFQSRSGYSVSQFSGNKDAPSGVSNRPLPLNLSEFPVRSNGTKEKRTPKANQLYRASEFVMGKEKMPPPENRKFSGSKRPPPVTKTESFKRPNSSSPDSTAGKLLSHVMKRCGQILTKLMKHKPWWVFNVPVDVVGMGLHDYNTLIKNPMDLGTVKKKLNQNLYTDPLEFAADVRLTFNNALIYNPKGHEVNSMAEHLLGFFEDMFNPAYKKYQEDGKMIMEEMRRNSNPWSRDLARKIEPTVTEPALEETMYVKKAEPISNQGEPPLKRTQMGKQPKPKAKDPNKREMSYEEKQKLSMNLQNLPQEKMDQVVQIIRKRNSNLAQDGDEIEVDIDVVDKETLWELDRFVYNCKKTLSKIKRKSCTEEQPPQTRNHHITVPDDKIGETLEAGSEKKSKKGEEEDVDIEDDNPPPNFPPVEIEKNAGCDSRSSSSSSSSSDSSSSSSDSDSGSSSGSDSDADDAQSPFVGSKPLPEN